MKKYFIFFILMFLFGTPFVYAEILNTTGFIPGQIWYSKDPFVEGDTVKIYTAVWNSSISPLSAKVEFYDKNVLLGFHNIVVPPSKLVDSSVSWKVTSGDHLISAKIISPSITLSGKKETISLDRSATSTDSRFIPVVIKKINGEPATSGDIVQSQIDKTTSSLNSIIPVSISEPVKNNLGFVDIFRDDTYKKISETKIETQNKIDLLNKIDNTTSSNEEDIDAGDISGNKKLADKFAVAAKSIKGDATEKPIAYTKLFFFSILSFIFGSKLVFYLLVIFVIFLILRFIYRKIRNR